MLTYFLLTDVSCVFRNGFVVVTLPMPSRSEKCEFTLRPVSHTVKDLVNFAKEEDLGIDRVAVYSMEGVRVSNATPIDILMQQDFKIQVNDKSFDIEPPRPGSLFIHLLESQRKDILVVQQIKCLQPEQVVWSLNPNRVTPKTSNWYSAKRSTHN